MKASNVLATVVIVVVISIAATLHFSKVAPWLKVTNFAKTMDTADVVFAVDETAGKLEITSGVGLDCQGKGCFKVKKGRSGRLKFQFDETEWQLVKFEICKGASKPTHPCSLDVWERMEFAASDTKAGSNLFFTQDDGIIDLTSVKPKPGTGYSEFYLFDQNAIKSTYFYSIEACKITAAETETDDSVDEAVAAATAPVGAVISSTCYSTDPPIKNGGRR